MLFIFGLLASTLIGISLGLIGGGGSILTVPVLVYLFHVDPVLATAYSLFIVGLSSLVGAFPKYKSGMIDMKTAVVFGIPSIIAVFVTRKVFVPSIPDTLFSISERFPLLRSRKTLCQQILVGHNCENVPSLASYSPAPSRKVLRLTP